VIAGDPLVYGFRNRDVQLSGLEWVGESSPDWMARWGLSVDGSFGLVEGEDRTSGNGLSEIPPWDLRAGLVWESPEEGRRAGVRLEARIVGAQTNPDPLLMPLYRDTDGFELWSLSGQLEIGAGWWVDLTVDNIFDSRTYEYLQAPVANGVFAPSSGTLKQGDSIPGFGRQVILSVRKDF